MRTIRGSYVDVGNFWVNEFNEFEFMDVIETDTKGKMGESIRTMRRHTMTSIMRRREESLSFRKEKGQMSEMGSPLDVKRLSQDILSEANFESPMKIDLSPDRNLQNT